MSLITYKKKVNILRSDVLWGRRLVNNRRLLFYARKSGYVATYGNKWALYATVEQLLRTNLSAGTTIVRKISLMPSLSEQSGFFNQLFVVLYGNSRPDIMKWNTPLWFLPCLFAVLVVVYVIERSMQNNVGGAAVRFRYYLSTQLLQHWLLP